MGDGGEAASGGEPPGSGGEPQKMAIGTRGRVEGAGEGERAQKETERAHKLGGSGSLRVLRPQRQIEAATDSSRARWESSPGSRAPPGAQRQAGTGPGRGRLPQPIGGPPARGHGLRSRQVLGPTSSAPPRARPGARPRMPGHRRRRSARTRARPLLQRVGDRGRPRGDGERRDEAWGRARARARGRRSPRPQSAGCRQGGRRAQQGELFAVTGLGRAEPAASGREGRRGEPGRIWRPAPSQEPRSRRDPGLIQVGAGRPRRSGSRACR